MGFVLRKPPELIGKHEAYPYQLDALLAVKSLPYAAIFHEQGLGKTKIATDIILTWLSEDTVDTVFVVTKKSLVTNWCDEFKSHSFITPSILSSNRHENGLALNSPVLVYIMNYEVISSNFSLINQFLNTCRVGAVLDESQKIKNPESKVSLSLHSLSSSFARKIIMTGTPVSNRPFDIWSQIKFLDNGKALGDFSIFKSSLDLPSNNAFNTNYGNQLFNVFKKIKPFSVRETKLTAGIDLPNKTILSHKVRLTGKQLEIYLSYKDEMAYELQDKNEIDDAEDILKRLLRLVQCASNPLLIDSSYSEIPAKFFTLTNLLEEIDTANSKVIIWTGFIENVNWIFKQLHRLSPEKIHSGMSIAERNNAIEKFKTNIKSKVLVATPGTAKEGLTLTIANHAIFFDRGFSLDDYLQAQDRIHRISQTDDCFIHNLIAINTIDEWVNSLLSAKFQAAQLTQGDITHEEFEKNFTFDLSGKLEAILS